MRMGARAARSAGWGGRLASIVTVCAACLACAQRAVLASSEQDERPRAGLRDTQPNPKETTGSEPSARSPVDPFARGALGIEFQGGGFGEAWNFNNNGVEWLVDGGAAVWWTYLDGAMLVVEFHATRVFQRSSHNGFVNALTPVLRWRLVGRPSWQVFADLGPGISWSDTVVPPRGTRFNYVALAGGGLMRRLGAQAHAVASFRWVHFSNAGREGRSRNPDIEALGGFAGVSVAF
jgi:hypothetical protein